MAEKRSHLDEDRKTACSSSATVDDAYSFSPETPLRKKRCVRLKDCCGISIDDDWMASESRVFTARKVDVSPELTPLRGIKRRYCIRDTSKKMAKSVFPPIKSAASADTVMMDDTDQDEIIRESAKRLKTNQDEIVYSSAFLQSAQKEEPDAGECEIGDHMLRSGTALFVEEFPETVQFRKFVGEGLDVWRKQDAGKRKVLQEYQQISEERRKRKERAAGNHEKFRRKCWKFSCLFHEGIVLGDRKPVIETDNVDVYHHVIYPMGIYWRLEGLVSFSKKQSQSKLDDRYPNLIWIGSSNQERKRILEQEGVHVVLQLLHDMEEVSLVWENIIWGEKMITRPNWVTFKCTRPSKKGVPVGRLFYGWNTSDASVADQTALGGEISHEEIEAVLQVEKGCPE